MVDIQDVDLVASQMEKAWGVDRLPRLVSDFMVAKFDQQRSAWDAAIRSGSDTQIDEIGGGMIRAWHKLDQMAREQGHRNLSETIWTVKHEGTGKIVGIYNGDINLVELRDVADCGFPLSDLVKFIPDILVSAIEAFPGSEIGELKDRKNLLDDDIPF